MRSKAPVRQKQVMTSRVRILVDPDFTPEALAALSADCGALRCESPDYAPGWHVLTAAGPEAALAMSAMLSGMPGVKEAAVIVGRRMSHRLIPSDTYFTNAAANAGYQWNLANTGARGGTGGFDLNTTTAWNTQLGTGVRLAVIDSGILLTHPDLLANVDAVTAVNHDFIDGDSNPAPADETDAHGTQCAGLAAARGNNSMGITGVAPQATLNGLRIDLAVLADDQEGGAFSWRNDLIAVKSSSWGSDDSGNIMDGPGPLAAAAINDAVATGRGGLGTVFVVAAGNGAAEGDDSNYDGYANRPGVISVSGTGDDGQPVYYAEGGANVLISTPTGPDLGSGLIQGISTIDLPSTGGDNDGTRADDYANSDYTAWFGGTSASAPQAAGVVALMLQARPQLSWRDVQEVLIASAGRILPEDRAWTTNAGGYAFHEVMGAGLADAAAAVTRAGTWALLPPRTSVVKTAAPALAVPDAPAAAASWRFDLAGDPAIRVEHVTLTADITHPSRGELDIQLISPGGMVSRLARQHDDPNPAIPWTYSSVRHWGENSHGMWTVRVADKVGGKSGLINALTLTLYGSAASAPAGPPVVTSPAALPATLGRPLAYQITASGAPVTFSTAAALPSWLTLSPGGLITGTPVATGNTTFTVRATNASGTGTRPVTITTSPASTLANAADLPSAVWRTSDTLPWTRVSAGTHDGVDAIKSPAAGNDTTSWIQTVVEGPALVSFWWRISSEEDFDLGQFDVDEASVAVVGGVVAWRKVERYLPAGRHLLRWSYTKDETDSAGSDTMWVDEVKVTPSNEIAPFILRPPYAVYAPAGAKTQLSIDAVGQELMTFQWQQNGINVPGATERTLAFPALSADQTGNYTCTVTNPLGSITSPSAEVGITPAALAAQLATALDTTAVTWGTSNVSSWSLQTTDTSDGTDAARSGPITHRGETVLQTCVTGPALMLYSSRVSSEQDYDFLTLYIDNVPLIPLSGEAEWTEESIPIPAGDHVVEWNYYKDETDEPPVGLDAGFVDAVSIIPTGYASWASMKFTPAQLASPGASGPGGDPDGDGIINLLEYALSLDPLVNSRAGLPTLTRSQSGLTFEYRENADLIDITYIVETTSELTAGTWSPVPAAPQPGPGRLMRAVIPHGSGSERKYARLRILRK